MFVKNLLTILISLFSGLTLAQKCLPEGINFIRQSQIDSFSISYSGCSEIEGNVFIRGGDINNLQGLIQLKIIWGLLSIDNTLLNSLEGLDSLSRVEGYLNIIGNPVIQGMNGLSSLREIGLNFFVYNNHQLKNFNGLERLNDVFTFHVGGNPSLENFEGLNNISEIGDFFVSGSGITSFSGLNNLNRIYGSLYINNNSSLPDFSGLDHVTSINGGVTIYSNSNLTSLTGLDSLQHIRHGLAIRDNPRLVDISALHNLDQLDGSLIIKFNDSLESLSGLEDVYPYAIDFIELIQNDHLRYCHVQSVCDFLEIGGESSIFANAEGCETSEEISHLCYITGNTESENNAITYYPNPVVGDLYITCDDHLETVSVFDLWGKRVFGMHDLSNKADLSFLPEGSYLLQIICGGIQIISKFIKTN